MDEYVGRQSELTHDYDGTLAEECVGKIVNQYILTFETFRQKAKWYIEELQFNLVSKG